MTLALGSPFEWVNPDAEPDLLLVCDHAANAVPAVYGRLGLPQDVFETHRAYDIGAADLARLLARRLNAPAVLGRWSRLVVDLNRGEDDPTVVPKLSDRQIIPGNAHADAAEIARRIANFHAPYHAAIAGRLRTARDKGKVPVLVSIHSFTPDWRGFKRPWHVGVLWDRDRRLAKPLLERFAREKDLVAGDNEPYSGALENDCLYRHGTMNGLPHVLIEVRQDLVADQERRTRMAALLDECLRDAMTAMGTPTLDFARAFALQQGDIAVDEKTRTELEAAAFRRLVAHLRSRTDVQNIDLMNLAGFCRNCLGDWYREAAAERGLALEKDQAREIVYGMSPAEWKKRYQKEASAEAQVKFAQNPKTHS